MPTKAPLKVPKKVRYFSYRSSHPSFLESQACR